MGNYPSAQAKPAPPGKTATSLCTDQAMHDRVTTLASCLAADAARRGEMADGRVQLVQQALYCKDKFKVPAADAGETGEAPVARHFF